MNDKTTQTTNVMQHCNRSEKMNEHIEAALMEAGQRINALQANEWRLIDELAALRKDAERYRWLRAQQWDTAQLCVVAEPKAAVKLGHCCPSGEYLDIAVDDAMLIGRAVGSA